MAKPIASRTDILIIPSNSNIQCSTFLPAVGKKVKKKKSKRMKESQIEREKEKERERESERERVREIRG